ncbi:MAG: DUF1670 domain-containing protein [Candidatus Hydrothermarchaeales archaeon]
MKVRTKEERLKYRSDRHCLMLDLNERYNLSIAAAEKLSEEIRDRYLGFDQRLGDGVMWYTAVDIDEPAGKPLKKCRKNRIKLTLNCDKDLKVEREHGLARLRYEKVRRLCWEAYTQKALLTQEDLARILQLSVSGIKKIVAQHKKDGNLLPTRGNYHDIGPGVSHKAEAVRLFLRGMTPSDVSWRIHHSVYSVERYIKDFCVVFMAHCEGYTPERISHMTRLSVKLVREYIALYVQFCRGDNKDFLKLIEIKLEKLCDFKKTMKVTA